MEIGAAVKILRKQLGYTQEDLVLNVPGYDGANLSRFERGLQSIDLDKLKSIASTLNVSLSDIFALSESEGLTDLQKSGKSGTSRLSTEINELVTHYTCADPRGRDSILSIARIQTDKRAIKNLPRSHDGDTKKPIKSKPVKAGKH